jgi:glycosyltransferase involved in cell wall biosynthesis
MPTFNRANVVGPALEAIIRERKENYPNIEIVVMDGGSTDGTVEIVKKFGDEIQILVSERDTGAADAFNKGVKLATGELIRYVASDDTILIGHTRRMVDYLCENPEIDLLGARSNCLCVDQNGQVTKDSKHAALRGGWMTFDEVLTWDRAGVFAYIETWFFRRRVFEKIGYLDTRYRICPDVDYAFRVAKSNCRFFVLPDVIVNKIFYSDGSNLVSNIEKSFAEYRQVVKAHASPWQTFCFLWSFPAPLPSRLFWGLWLKTGKALRHTFPWFYKMLQLCARRLKH